MDTFGIKQLIDTVDLDRLDAILSKHPRLANEAIPFDEENPALAHPLHRLCDGVFAGRYRETDATRMATILLRCGARVDGVGVGINRDTPLIAAASLDVDALALAFIDAGADIHHRGTHGGTALHWACWRGRERIIERLLREEIDVNQRCTDFLATPLGWAVHGYRFSNRTNANGYFACVRLLLNRGADKEIPNREGLQPCDLLGELDGELKQLLCGAR